MLLFRIVMNKNVVEIYECALKMVMEEYGVTEGELFTSNEADCVQARQALIIGASRLGLSDKEIAECTHKMRRCSVCKVRNRYDDRIAPWTVLRCIERIRGEGNKYPVPK